MTIPRIIPRAEHPISRGYIDPDALRVLYRLHRGGFKAYLVGGSVRDLMTGRTPKDFDVGTDARPQEIRRLFRNSRIIGRRFRLAHILFEGGKYVEVSTFRRTPEREDAESGADGEADLLIRSDNVFGSPEEDAERRDFTINGLFYDIATYSVLDYVGGVTDLEKRLVRTIGDPLIRFREDPVRMLRACEFAARLNFRMDPGLVEAIGELKKELRRSAAPRVTEELLDPLRRGWGHDTYRLWNDMGLLGVVLPELAGVAGPSAPEAPFATLFWRMLHDLDARRQAGEKHEDPVLLGALFLPLVLSAIRRRGAGGRVDPSQILLVLENVVNPLALRMSLPNLATHLVKQSLYTLGSLTATRPDQPAARRLVTRSWFPHALALLSPYSKASGRYHDASAAWQDVLARAGRPAAGS
ncbi:MAG TPA: polynucleotide adenylyltransferase PcnB, partial [Thermoanaerobaculia bacterium]|nr:polynucleotide adenylyltransferase PcnB [Thermoanaerobaculia bacterium]